MVARVRAVVPLMFRSHVAHGVTTGAWLAAALPVPNGVRLGVTAVTAAAALVPDIDHHNALLTVKLGPIGWVLSGLARLVGGGRHRGWTHTPFGAAVFGGATAGYTATRAGELAGYWWAWGLAMFAGCLAHRWGDCRTEQGCPPWTWLPGRPYGPHVHYGRSIGTGSAKELYLWRFVYRRVAVGSVLAALVLEYKLIG